MGTRSTYRIIEKREEDVQDEIALIYVQYDGYPEGHPLSVAEYLSSGTLVNGYDSSMPSLTFNGAGCLAARLIGFLKQDKTGNVYLYPSRFRGNSGEDYLYDIIVNSESNYIEMVCYTNGYDYPANELFRGTPQDFVEFVNKPHNQTV